MQYLTAYGALIEFGGLKKNDFVLITAASSSVGIAAIEIARAEGAIRSRRRGPAAREKRSAN